MEMNIDQSIGLRAEVEYGSVPARDIIERAKREFGINERLLQQAREKMGVVATKAGYQDAWIWSFPLKQESNTTFSFSGQPKKHRLSESLQVRNRPLPSGYRFGTVFELHDP
jgi:hypothetical protein